MGTTGNFKDTLSKLEGNKLLSTLGIISLIMSILSVIASLFYKSILMMFLFALTLSVFLYNARFDKMVLLQNKITKTALVKKCILQSIKKD